MKRITVLAVLLLAGVLAACAGETEPATDLTPTSAKLHSAVNCESDNSGEWWYEIAYDPGNTGIFTFDQIGPQHDFDCPADENPGVSGYQCSAGVCNGPFDVTYQITTASGWLTQCKGYVYRIRARIDNGNGGSAYMWVDSNGTVNDNVYDEIPWNRAGSSCPNGRL